MYESRDLQALAAVVEQQGFERAAEWLSITQSAVSQRIRKLETTVGHKLLLRASPPRLTPRGELVLTYFRRVAHLQQDLQGQLAGGSRGWQSLALGANADSLATWLPGALDSLMQEHPVLLDLQVDDQDQTHAMLRRGEVLACISSSPEGIAGCHCFALGTMRYRGLAAPEFRARHFPQGVSAQALAQAPCVEFSARDDLQRRYLREYFQLEYRGPRHRIPDTENYLDFIRRGRAWGTVPDLQGAPLMASGALQELVPDQPVDVTLYWHIWNLQTRLQRELTDHIRRAASAVLAPPTDPG